MSDDYTPTTGAVRSKYSRGMKSDGTPTQFVKWQKEFDRWLAEVRKDEREKVAREIEAAASKCHKRGGGTCGSLWRKGMDDAARIARGATS